MANQKFTIQLDFTTGSSLDSIKKDLQKIAKVDLTGGKLLAKGFSPKEKDELIKDFQSFSDVLANSFNKNLGKMSPTALQQGLKNANLDINDLQRRLEKAGIYGRTSFDEMRRGLYGFNQESKNTDTFLSRLTYTFANTARWRAANMVLNQITKSIQDAYYFTKDLDRSLTNISIVSGKTHEEMIGFAEEANRAAKTLGTTTLAFAEASLVYFQQGMSADDVRKMTEATIIGSNIAQENTQVMSELLTATMNGYRLAADQAINVTDKLAAVGAATAADFYELSTAMSKVSSIANVSGVSMDQLAAQIATIVSVTKDAPESVGNSLKTIFTRMLAFKNETKGLMVDENGESFGVPSVEAALKKYNALTGANISLFKVNKDGKKELQDVGTILEQVGDSWQNTNDLAAKFGLATALAGSRQQNRLISLFDSWEMYRDTVITSQEAMGTAYEQQAIYLESYEGKLKSLKTSMESLYMTILDEGFLEVFIGGLTGLVDGINGILKSLGGFPTILGTISGLLLAAFAPQAILKFSQKVSEVKMNVGSTTKEVSILTQAEKEMALIRKTYSAERIAQLEEQHIKNTQDILDTGNKISQIEKLIQLNKELNTLEKTAPSVPGAEYESQLSSAFAEFQNVENIIYKANDLKKGIKTPRERAPNKNQGRDNIPNILGRSQTSIKEFEENLPGLKIPKNIKNDYINASKEMSIAVSSGKTIEIEKVNQLRVSYENLLNVIKAYIELQIQESGGTEQLTQQLTELKAKMKELNAQGDSNRKMMYDSAESAREWTQAISMGTMALTSFTNILQNENLDSMEKFQSALGTIGTSVLLFSTGDIVSAATTKFGSLAASFGGAASIGQKLLMVIKSIVFAIKKVAGPIGIALTIAGALATAITAITNNLNKNEKALQKNSAEIGSLKGKIQELESLGSSATESDLIMLELYKEQLSILEYQTKELRKQVALKALFGENNSGGGLIDKIKAIQDEINNITFEPETEPQEIKYTAEAYIEREKADWAGAATSGTIPITPKLDSGSKDKYIKQITDEIISIQQKINAVEIETRINMEALDPESPEYKEVEGVLLGFQEQIKNLISEGATKAEIDVTELQKLIDAAIPDTTTQQDLYDIDNVIKYQEELNKVADIKDRLKSSGKIELNDIKYLIDNNQEYADDIKANINNKKALLGIIEDIQETNRKTEIADAKAALDAAIRSRDEINQTQDREIALAKENKQLLINNALRTGLSQIELQRGVTIFDNQIVESEAAKSAGEDLVKAAQAFYDAIINAGPTTEGTGADKWKEKFDSDLADLKYSFDKGVINAEQYYKSLQVLNEKYFGKGKTGKYKEEYRQYELEALEGLRSEYKKQYDERFALSKDWIATKKEEGKLTTEQEISAWERVRTYTKKYYQDAIKAAGDNKVLRLELEKEFAEKTKDINESILKAEKEGFKNSLELLDDNIADQEYYDKLTLENHLDLLNERRRLLDEALSKELITYEEYARSVIDNDKKIYEAKKESIEKEQQDLEDLVGAVEWYADTKIKALEDEKATLEATNKATQDQITLQKLQDALQTAKMQRTKRVYYQDRGWVWEADQKAIADAQAALDEFNFQKQLDAIDEQINKWEEYKEQWQSVTETYKVEQNKLILEQQLGAEWENELLNQRTTRIKEFATAYSDTYARIIALQKEFNSLINQQGGSIGSYSGDGIDRSKVKNYNGVNYESSIDYSAAITKAKKQGAPVDEVYRLERAREAKIYGDKMTQYYADGGVADYTGPAQIHGKPNAVETIFNATDGKKLFDFINKIPNIADYVAGKFLQSIPSNYFNPASSSLNNNMGTNLSISNMTVYTPDANDFMRQMKNLVAITGNNG